MNMSLTWMYLDWFKSYYDMRETIPDYQRFGESAVYNICFLLTLANTVSTLQEVHRRPIYQIMRTLPLEMNISLPWIYLNWFQSYYSMSKTIPDYEWFKESAVCEICFLLTLANMVSTLHEVYRHHIYHIMRTLPLELQMSLTWMYLN